MTLEIDLIRVLAALGVPGVALGVFFLLLRRFNFQFTKIGRGWTAAIAIIFLLMVGIVTIYALHRWTPSQNVNSDSASNLDNVTYVVNEEKVTYEQLLRSLYYDIIKINAHTHWVGVSSEYHWIRQIYPGSRLVKRALVSFKPSNDRTIFFDLFEVKLEDGRKKEIFFDITSFFDGASSPMAPDEILEQKLKEIYR